MTTVETIITVSIPEGADLAAVERLVKGTVEAAGRELVAAACLAMEEQLLTTAGPRLRREKQRALWLLTGFGWVQLHAGKSTIGPRDATGALWTRPWGCRRGNTDPGPSRSRWTW